MRESAGGRGFVDGGDGGDRVADVAHLVARQREFVLRDRDHAVGHVAFVAGDHGAHAGQGQRLADIDFEQFGVGVGAAQELADQGAVGRQVGGVARGAGDLLDAVDQAAGGRRRRAARPALAISLTLVSGAFMPRLRHAASTDSMILT
jgi:hypothetical protein